MTLKVNDIYSKRIQITEEIVNNFSEITGDKNPVHIDDEFAKKSIYKKRIAHGMLIGSLISSVIGNDFPGKGTIYISQSLRFIKPVFFDECILITIEVIKVELNNWIKLKTIVYNEENSVSIDGEAVICPPEISF